jgi:hypothetical protein
MPKLSTKSPRPRRSGARSTRRHRQHSIILQAPEELSNFNQKIPYDLHYAYRNIAARHDMLLTELSEESIRLLVDTYGNSQDQRDLPSPRNSSRRGHGSRQGRQSGGSRAERKARPLR